MKDLIRYKDFLGSVHYNSEDDLFFGKIEGINDLISFEGTTVKQIKKSFEDAVDDYLEVCREMGKDPQKSYKGVFNVRVHPDLHKQVVELALIKGMTLNQFVQIALKDEVEKELPRVAGNVV